MLVLSRRIDEVICIGPDITVMVVDIRGDKVRLGVTAPKELAIHRKEVADAIAAEQRQQNWNSEKFEAGGGATG